MKGFLRSKCLLSSLLVLLGSCATRQQEKTVTIPLKPQLALKLEEIHSEAATAYAAECKEALNQGFQRFESLVAQEDSATKLAVAPGVPEVLAQLNELFILIDGTASKASLYRNVHPDGDMRKVASACEREFANLSTEISLSRPLYERLAAVNLQTLAPLEVRLVNHLLRDFRLSGVDKEPAVREEIKRIKDELVLLGQEFDQNIRADVRVLTLTSLKDLAGLPKDYIKAHTPKDWAKRSRSKKENPPVIKLTTDYPDYLPFMSYAKNDALRLEFYRLFRKRGYPQNIEVLNKLLGKRYRLARLLGFASYADYITQDKMIKNKTALGDFISEVSGLAKERMERDYQELLQYLQKHYDKKAKAVGDWQKAYLEEHLRREKYKYNAQEAREYFPYGRVKQGVLDITSKLFGLTYTPVTAPTWHKSVEVYNVRRTSDQELLGRFYLDMHPRQDKYKHAAMFQIKSGIKNRQIPEAALVCNFAKSTDDPEVDNSETLLEHNDVETFFHEFGHLLHHILAGSQKWVNFSGIATEWDFVEAPSQMLEEWAFAKEALKSFAKNAKGKVIKDSLITSLNKARNFGKGLWIEQQMFYAALSLNYHQKNPAELDLLEEVKELQAKYSPFAYVDDTYFHLSFGHLNGYSALYYTYMWSLVIAKDLFSEFLHHGLFDLQTASRYVERVLAPGGAKDAGELVHDFLGREYSTAAFAAWLQE